MVIGGAQGRLTCSIRRERGEFACSNGRGVQSEEVEWRVTTALRQMLLEPGVVEETLREYQVLSGQRRRESLSARAKQQTELAEVKHRAARVVDQVADGVLSGAAMKEHLDGLEVSRAGLEAELVAVPAESGIVRHPAGLERFRRLVGQLNAVLATADTNERQAARNAFRR